MKTRVEYMDFPIPPNEASVNVYHGKNRGYYMAARGYEFHLRVRDTFSTRK